MVIIEHNLDAIKAADYVIDLGQEGEEGDGKVVVVGSFEDIVKMRGSWTGKFLGKVL